jgi:hypothetical protein
MDASLYVTLGVVFVATLIGSLLGSTRKDRCLSDFEDFHITLEHSDGRVIWGVMSIQPTGFELIYREGVRHSEALIKTSYVFYREEYPKILGFYRYTDDLAGDRRRRRERSLKRAFHPGPVSFFTRRLRNFVSTAVDSLSDIATLLLGRTKVVNSQMVMPPGQAHLSGLTKEVLGYVGTSYDPLLESFVGSEVVVEMRLQENIYEYVGVLKDYSRSFFELLDVEFCQPLSLEIAAPEPETVSKESVIGIEASIQENLLIVVNHRDDPIMLSQIVAADGEHALDVIIEAGREYRHLLGDTSDTIAIHLRTIRQLDMILPRNITLLRHRAERYRTIDALNLRLQIERLLDDPSQDTEADIALLRNEQIRDADRRLADTLQQRDRIVADVAPKV